MKSKFHTFLALLALVGFAFLGAAELTGNQSSIFIKPQVDVIYGASLTSVLASISSFTVAGALLVITIFGSRMKGIHSIFGFAVMAICYTILAVWLPPAGVAVVLLGLVGAASIAIAFIRHAAERVDTGLPISPNQVVGGALVILSQLAPALIAASGSTFGARATWGGVAGTLLLACGLGYVLFRRYGTQSEETPHEETTTERRAWTAWSAKATLVNGFSAMAIGAVLGPLTSDIAQRGLPQATWVGVWSLGSVVIGVFMMFLWTRVASAFQDRGLALGAIITLMGGIFAVAERNVTGGAALLAGGLLVNLGANSFESSLYSLRPSSAQAVAMNFGRALGFGVGAYLGLLLVPHTAHAWLTLGTAVIGVVATFLLRRNWQREVEHPLTLRSVSLWLTVIFGLLICIALGVIGGPTIAVGLAGVAAIVAVAIMVSRLWRR